MKQAIITTTWIGSGTDIDPFRPAIADKYKTLRCKDLDNKTAKFGEPCRVYIEVDDKVADLIAVIKDVDIEDRKAVELQKIPIMDKKIVAVSVTEIPIK